MQYLSVGSSLTYMTGCYKNAAEYCRWLMLSDIKFNVHYEKNKCTILSLTFNGEKREKY